MLKPGGQAYMSFSNRWVTFFSLRVFACIMRYCLKTLQDSGKKGSNLCVPIHKGPTMLLFLIVLLESMMLLQVLPDKGNTDLDIDFGCGPCM